MSNTRAVFASLAVFTASIFSLVLAPTTAHAVISVTGVDRVSKAEIADNNGAVTIYGGVAGGTDRCDAVSTTATCNNCLLKTGETVPFGTPDNGLLACNERRIHPTLQLVITISSDALNGVPSITSSDGQTAIPMLSSNAVVQKGTAVSIVVNWSDVCSKILTADTGSGGAGTDACTPVNGNAAGTLRVGISSDGDSLLNASTDDVKTINFVIRNGVDNPAAGTASLAANCTTATDAQICYFEMGPGDEKAVVKSLLAPSGSGFPSTSNSQVKFVRFLFAEQGFNYITLASDHVDLPVSGADTSSFSVSPRRIEGLKNDVQYYFKNALVDTAGNISLYSQAANDGDCSNSPSGGTDCRIVTPSEVVGVLDKTNCFIATAAYGTQFAKELDTLRDFRDQILLSNGIGHRFVRWYYDHSPKYAKMILDHPFARATVRAGLVPVVWFAGMVLAYGPLKASLAFLVSLILIAALISLGRRPDVRAAARKNYVEMKKRAGRSFLPVIIALFVPLTFASPNAHAASRGLAQALDDETPPPPEYPYPGASGAPTSTLPETPLSNGADILDDEFKTEPQAPSQATTLEPEPIIDVTPPEAPQKSLLPRPKAITEEGDYIYEKLPDHPPKKYGKPKPKKFSNLPGREKPMTITADGEFQYPVEHSPFVGAAGLRFGMMSPPSIRNASNGLSFKDIYGQDDIPAVLFEYEYPFTRKIGRIGLKFETGVYAKQAGGRFKNPARAGEIPEERFTFLMIPLQVMLHYRFQFADTQLFVPFIEGGGAYNGIAELRDDNKKPRLGAAPAVIAGGGVNILLDWLDRRAIHQLDNDYGINHVWFTAQYRQVIGLKSDLDISSHLISGGFTFDF